MLVALEIPIRMELWSSESSTIENLNAVYRYKKHHCTVSFYGDAINEIDGDPRMFSRSINKIIFLITDTDDYLKQKVEAKLWIEVEERLRRVANRFVKALRNHGKVIFLHELTVPSSQYEAEARIRNWGVKAGDSVDDMTEILPKLGLFGALLSNSFPTQQFPSLNIYNWLDVLESLKSSDSPFLPEENEFTVNALENLRLKNYRLAVMEMIIALEIVLDRYFQIYLRDYKGLSPERVKKFLSPQLGLTAKVSALLNITCEDYLIEDIDFDTTLKVIEWRNNIVHEIGNKLPADNPQRIEDALDKVKRLIHSIRFKIDHLRDCLEFKKIGSIISEKFQLPEPNIIRTMTYSVTVRFVLFQDMHSMLNDDKVVELVNDLRGLLNQYDCRFEDYIKLKTCFIEYPSGQYLIYDGDNFEQGAYSKVYFEQVNGNGGDFRIRIIK